VSEPLALRDRMNNSAKITPAGALVRKMGGGQDGSVGGVTRQPV
jgi:hypothetical protein